MDVSKLERLRMAHIETPCPKDWDKMLGDEQRRYCEGCGCHVHNIAAMSTDEADRLLSAPGHLCARITVDAKLNILTRDGWIPRMMAAGAIATMAAGCAPIPTHTAVPNGATVPSGRSSNSFEDLIHETLEIIEEAIFPNAVKQYTPSTFTGAMAVFPPTSMLDFE